MKAMFLVSLLFTLGYSNECLGKDNKHLRNTALRVGAHMRDGGRNTPTKEVKFLIRGQLVGILDGEVLLRVRRPDSVRKALAKQKRRPQSRIDKFVTYRALIANPDVGLADIRKLLRQQVVVEAQRDTSGTILLKRISKDSGPR